MLNSGGAVLDWAVEKLGFAVRIRGEGRFVAHASAAPTIVDLDGRSLGRPGNEWTFEDGTVAVEVPETSGSVEHTLVFRF
jgi:hypothetical protein